MNAYGYGCISKTVYVYHMSNNIEFNIMSMKTNNTKILIIHKQNKELEIVTKTNEPISRSPNHCGPSTKHPLKVMHLKK